MGKDDLLATVSVELDGQDMELIIRELGKGVKRELLKGNFFQAQQLNRIKKRLIRMKKEFHHHWEEILFWR